MPSQNNQEPPPKDSPQRQPIVVWPDEANPKDYAFPDNPETITNAKDQLSLNDDLWVAVSVVCDDNEAYNNPDAYAIHSKFLGISSYSLDSPQEAWEEFRLQMTCLLRDYEMAYVGSGGVGLSEEQMNIRKALRQLLLTPNKGKKVDNKLKSQTRQNPTTPAIGLLFITLNALRAFFVVSGLSLITLSRLWTFLVHKNHPSQES